MVVTQRATRRRAGQIWGPVKLQVHVDVLEWIDSHKTRTECLKQVFDQALDTYIICHRTPEEDLPPKGMRDLLDTTVPVALTDIIDWWAEIRGVMRAKLIRSLLTDAYNAALLNGWRAPTPEDTA